MRQMLSAVPRNASCVTAERTFLLQLEGGCQAPMAAYAYYEGDTMVLDALVGRPDGSVILRASTRGPRESAVEMGKQVAADLLEQGAGPILEELIEAAKTE